MNFWTNDALSFARKVKSSGLSWEQTAEILEIDKGIVTTGNAVRKALSREIEKKITIPPAIAHPLPPILDIAYRNCLVLYDIHGGYHHVKHIENAVKLALAASVDTLITDADIFDFDSLSKYTKRSKELELNDELEVQGNLLYTLGNLFKVYMMGANHGSRLVNKLNQPLDLSRIVAMALNGKSADVTTTNREYMFMADFAFAHPSDMSSSVIGKVPSMLAMKYNKHTLTGHTHKRGYTYAPNGKLALEVGCALDGTHVAYKQLGANAYSDFMLGFALILDGEVYHFDNEGNTTLNGNVKKPFSHWERYLSK